jgi:glycerol-3-phosphate dehydrogenase
VNAAGPWVSRFLEEGLGIETRSHVRLVKGSHIVVPRLHPGDHAYILQNDDKRIVFVIPYQDRLSLIGTTDVAFDADPASVRISDAETDYLCRVVNRYFRKPIGPSDVVWSYAGVRPLYDDASANVSAVTRDYVFDLDAGPDRPPLLSVFGGKLTTYRRLAEHALEKLRPVMGFAAGPWTGPAHLPGGDIEGADLDGFLARLKAGHPWLPPALAERYGRAYGTRVERLLDGASGIADLGQDLGEGVFEAEIDYLVAHEWARTAEDVLWRRSKLGLQVGAATLGALERRLDGLPATAAGRLTSVP